MSKKKPTCDACQADHTKLRAKVTVPFVLANIFPPARIEGLVCDDACAREFERRVYLAVAETVRNAQLVSVQLAKVTDINSRTELAIEILKREFPDRRGDSIWCRPVPDWIVLLGIITGVAGIPLLIGAMIY